MGSEYFINSQDLEDQVRKLLPSQGGAGAGFDLSASTQIIPIIDLTESAEGANLRQDLQRSISFKNVTSFDITNSATTVVNTTGFFRILGSGSNEGGAEGLIQINDGATTKDIFTMWRTVITDAKITSFDLNVFLSAGDSLIVNSPNTNISIRGITYQIASIDGTLNKIT